VELSLGWSCRFGSSDIRRLCHHAETVHRRNNIDRVEGMMKKSFLFQ